MKYILAFAAIIILVVYTSGCGGKAESQTTTTGTATWAAPTYGTPAVRYALQAQVNVDGLWQELSDQIDGTEYSFTISFDDSTRVRVCAIDADDVRGPLTEPSDWLWPAGLVPGEVTNLKFEIKE
jgi:hypothetical protein